MVNPPVIHAVIWIDLGLPLSLPCKPEAEAIASAQSMRKRAMGAGVSLHHLRAVRLSADDKLHTLWAPSTDDAAPEVDL